MTADYARLPYRRGVGIVLFNREGKVFVAQRLDNPGHAWQLPQGGIDAGEEPMEAALRELEEETGVQPRFVEVMAESRGWLRYDLPDTLVPGLWGGKYRGQEQKWFAFRFLGDDSHIDIRTAHPEFSAWRWADFTSIAGTIVPFKKTLYEQLIAEFNMLIGEE
ncbi:MAG TPA: RNA pyrophosphohydrolase [Dongiaceae bacterium]|jgi:putative (di)nucleoside polyphosphate hydrolase|nr:RNA pyrophosphohydrolase [Dongiaceae bacterium]